MGKLQSLAICAWPEQVCKFRYMVQRFDVFDEATATNERGWKAFAEPVLVSRRPIAALLSYKLLQQHQHCSLLFQALSCCKAFCVADTGSTF